MASQVAMRSESTSSTSSTTTTKKTPNDFLFGRQLGEGSFSTVYLAKELETGKEYAIKVLEKNHIIRERKSGYVMREKSVLLKLNHPFFIRLYCTFQDADRLYFVMNYASRGELLDYLNKLACFDDRCSSFYAAEIVLALEYLHGLGIIHRDLKPENILLNEKMHIQITDFGSAKILEDSDSNALDNATPDSGRRNSFVGTAQYVSPEVLGSKNAYYSSDLWALGCIIYQFLSGLPPFRGGHEYQIFQKISKLDYDFPEGFNPVAKDLVSKLLVIDPTQRLGCQDMGGYNPLKNHEFFRSIDWENLPETEPPTLLPFLPAAHGNPDLWSNKVPGFDAKRMVEFITTNLTDISEEERRKRLEKQSKENEYHRFVEGHLILKQGLIDKRKGLFARRRMFLLTEGPHLYYVDPVNKVLKGQVPWSENLRPEAKNFKIFFVHTPNRTYYLEDPNSRSEEWVKKLQEVWQRYYG
ncbi:3-phosphoinositide-dependent protein kinase 1 [Patella vulgata]|uniref:3-phosphoinositide-dependent protein kinase 1 n=1 Tax=Patella vulgata TaxID=6465 RepID=UPI00217FD20A|nr:3-phosphoinositide-dependent protein kinase 1 [Patella vulgata]